MARITLNADTTLSSAALALPDNARIVVIDADTDTTTADLTINGAESLIVTDDAVQITAAESDGATETQVDPDFADTVIAEMLGILGMTADDCVDNDSADNDGTEDTDDEADEIADDNKSTNSAVPTAIRNTTGAVPKYTIYIEYDNESSVYTDHNTGTIIPDEAVIDIINCAYETNADVTMTFDIPGHGMTTFIGDLVDGYPGYDGLVLVSTTGGAYVLSSEQELTDDMSVLTEARFTFTGDAETLLEKLEVNIVDADDGSDDDEDHSDSADHDTEDHNTARAQNIPTFDADGKFYVNISSRGHNLSNVGIRHILHYAATHDLSARLLIEGEREPYVGRLQMVDKDADTDAVDTAQYVFVDKKRGAVQIDLDKTDLDAGFRVLEIYSDADMRRRGFAGTNHTEYDEISIAQMHKHLIVTLAD